MTCKKKILAIVITALIVLTAILALTACDKLGNSFSWNDYIPSYEYMQNISNHKMPTIQEISGENVGTSKIGQGVLEIREGNEHYGYIYKNNKYFGKGEGFLSLTKYPVKYARGETCYLIGISTSQQVLYDCIGNEVCRGYRIAVGVTNAFKNNVFTAYLSIKLTANKNAESETFFLEILEDGSVSHTKTTSLTNEVEDAQPLATLIGIDMSINYDEYLASIAVKDFRNKWTFYRDGKEISSLTFPENCTGGKYYIDGKILYITATAVDDNALWGYNFVNSFGNKYNWKLFSFNISNGKTTRLQTDFVMSYNDFSLGYYNSYYNYTKKAYDLVMFEGYKMVNGIANGNKYKNVYFINSNAHIVYDGKKSENDRPYIKMGNNILTYKGNIVAPNGTVIASIGTFPSINSYALLADRIVLNVDGKIGAIDFDGNIIVDFQYNHHWTKGVYDKYTLVTDDEGSLYILDIITGDARPVWKIYNTTNDKIKTCLGFLIGIYEDATDSYSWYDLSGQKVIDKEKEGDLMYSMTTINGKTEGTLMASIITDTTGESRSKSYIITTYM